VTWGPAAGDDCRKEVESFFTSNPHGRLEVDRESRLATARNHTATHLLHSALKKILGKHVAQAGSLVEPERLRFDFQHHMAMTDEEVRQVEDRVNDAVLADLAVTSEMLPFKEAVAGGAVALFGEKYADEVRVIAVDDVSKELCGGTHLNRTGEIGTFVIKSETAVAAGIRRIEALTGRGARKFYKRMIDERSDTARLLKVSPEDLGRRVQAIILENDRLKKELRDQESHLADGRLGETLRSAEDVGGISLVTMMLKDGDVGSLRRWGDRIRDKMDAGVGLLCLTTGKKPMLLIIASDRVIKEKGVKANELAVKIGEALSLRGGGKAHMAQMGLGTAAEFEKVKGLVRDLLAKAD
jgi:alanyl-tRNA synthetase